MINVGNILIVLHIYIVFHLSLVTCTCLNITASTILKPSYFNPPNAEATFIQTTRWKDVWKSSKPCHVGIHYIAHTECFHMYTQMPGFQQFSAFVHHFVLAKLATTSISVKNIFQQGLTLTLLELVVFEEL